MTGQSEQERRDRWKALGIRTDIPHPARVYDYLLGGKDNFAVDREAAEMSLRISPEIRDSARANRMFLVRAVRFLRDSGIRQFLDVGTGLPTTPNTYEVARSGHPDARVVYVDNDPVVFLHAESLMADHETTTVVRADLRDVDEVLAEAGKLLDFTKPVGLLFVACLHNIPDHDDPAGIVARYLTALAPGSYLVISHVTDEFDPEAMHAITAEYAKRGTVFVGRSKEAIRRMLNGTELVDPGVVLISYWRPDSGSPTGAPTAAIRATTRTGSGATAASRGCEMGRIHGPGRFRRPGGSRGGAYNHLRRTTPARREPAKHTEGADTDGHRYHRHRDDLGHHWHPR